MDLKNHVSSSFVDAQKRVEKRLLHHKVRKTRRGDKIGKFLDKLDPSKRVGDSHAR